jgi:hypothetical protein
MDGEEVRKEIREYIWDYLSINIKEEGYGFNGRHIVIELQLDGTVISSASHIVKQDEG